MKKRISHTAARNFHQV